MMMQKGDGVQTKREVFACAPQQCAFAAAVPGAYAGGVAPQYLAPCSLSSQQRVVMRILGVVGKLSVVIIPSLRGFAQGGYERYGRQVVIGIDFPSTPFYPESFDGWFIVAMQVWPQVQWTRIVGGYRGWMPLLNSDMPCLLPDGEFVRVRCLMVHKDGTWEGRIVLPTMTDRAPVESPLLHLQRRLRGHDAALHPNQSGYREGHVVRWGNWGGHWYPVEAPGGFA